VHTNIITQLHNNLIGFSPRSIGAGKREGLAESATKLRGLFTEQGAGVLDWALASLYSPASIARRYKERIALTFLGTKNALKEANYA